MNKEKIKEELERKWENDKEYFSLFNMNYLDVFLEERIETLLRHTLFFDFLSFCGLKGTFCNRRNFIINRQLEETFYE